MALEAVNQRSSSSLRAEPLSDVQLTVGAAVVVCCRRSCRGLGVTVGIFFGIASLSLSFGSLGLSEDRGMKEEVEQIIIII